MTRLFFALVLAAFASTAWAASHEADCSGFNIDPLASQPLSSVAVPPAAGCQIRRTAQGYVLPDPKCTPGAINPTLTAEVLRTRGFTTRCVRNDATKPREKAQTYDWYQIEHPDHNQGQAQVCELDHLVSLELGGADTLDNIWPQCGPSGVTLLERYFKQKDIVENYLAKQVREGAMNLGEAQRGIASDWTQYLNQARAACPDGKCGR